MIDVLPAPSISQKTVMEQIKDNNVIVDSVAGSGKTTTILHCAVNYPETKILLLTYNKKLKIETRDKIIALKLNNIEAHSYHSFCVKYYMRTCYTDTEMIGLLNDNVDKIQSFHCDILILDEAQDITPTYYTLICKIVKDLSIMPKMLILGDQYQSIFKFNGADARFIISGHKLFNFNLLGWKKIRLSTSFRITQEMANFINHCILKQERLFATKSGNKVKYIVCDTFTNYVGRNKPYDIVKKYLDDYYYNDIFILAPSVRSKKSPIRQLANKLSEEGIPVYVPNNDDEKLDDDILKNKIAFSTFHQVKGLERNCVIVFNLDDSYFRFYKKDANPNICPNEIYVALTRAKKDMTVLHHYQNDYLSFISIENIKKLCDFEGCKIKLQKHTTVNKPVPVTELTKHLPSEVLLKSIQYIKIKNIHQKEDKINIQSKTQQGSLYESVSEITGTAIPAYYEYKTTNKMKIYNDVIKNFNTFEEDEDNKVTQKFSTNMFNKKKEFNKQITNRSDIKNIELKQLSIQQLLTIANYYCALRSQYIYKINQIKNYDWINEEQLNNCINRLAKQVTQKSIFEFEVTPTLASSKEIIGFIDCIDVNKVWEFKCVNELDSTHYVQLAVYAFLFENHKYKLKKSVEDGSIMKNVNLKKDDQIKFTSNNFEYMGQITTIYKNGTINVKTSNGVKKITCEDITYHQDIENIKQAITCLSNMKHHYYLFNILTNEINEIEFDLVELTEMVNYLVQQKYFNNDLINDKEFFDRANKIRKQFD